MNIATECLVAGLLASLACGLGVLPLAFGGEWFQRRIGLGYALAGGLMFAASVYNLLLPAFTLGTNEAIRLLPVLQTLGGMFAGCGFLWMVERWLTPERLAPHGCDHSAVEHRPSSSSR